MDSVNFAGGWGGGLNLVVRRLTPQQRDTLTLSVLLARMFGESIWLWICWLRPQTSGVNLLVGDIAKVMFNVATQRLSEQEMCISPN